MKAEWERIESVSMERHGQGEGLGFHLWRSQVPGGWLVASREAQTGPLDQLTFVADPHHDWLTFVPTRKAPVMRAG